jgi:hypothetical protein
VLVFGYNQVGIRKCDGGGGGTSDPVQPKQMKKITLVTGEEACGL